MATEPMQAVESVQEAWDYAQDYLGSIEDGHRPDLADFLEEEVPEHQRERVFEILDRALANCGEEAEADHLEPRVELVAVASKPKPMGGSWVRAAGILVPGEIRGQIVREILIGRDELHDAGNGRLRIEARALRELIEAIAQRAPLRPPSEHPNEPSPTLERVRKAGWISWRLSGTALLAGYLLGSIGLLALGAVLLLGSMGALIALTIDGADRLTGDQARYVNALLGGTVTALTLIAGYATICATLLAVSALPGLDVLATIAVHTLVLLSTATLSVTGLSGWTPEEWLPERLVRV